VWQTTDLIGQLSIQAAGDNTPPGSLAEIPPDAPITGIHIRAGYNFGYPWFGYVDNVTIGFRGRTPQVFNFELANPARSRIRPTLSWAWPAPIDTGTALSSDQLRANSNVPGVFAYSPSAGTTLPAEVQGLFADFTPSDPSIYLPVSHVVPLTVTGTRTVAPDDPNWFKWQPDGSDASITGANPQSGWGSLELTKGVGGNSALTRDLHVLEFGKLSELTSLSMDWFIDPASEAAFPPELALRVYEWGDPRSFFLYWDTCSAETPCDPHPTGSWQSTNLMGRLRIQGADGNLPPASLAEVPPDAPIVGVHVRANFANGRPWHGFADNVAIGFAGREPIVFNFEIDPPIQH
jgi:hypothetical protein